MLNSCDGCEFEEDCLLEHGLYTCLKESSENSVRPRNCNYKIGNIKINDVLYAVDDVNLCIKCRYSVPNRSYNKDEFDCFKTKGICQALCVCDFFEKEDL